MARTKYLTEERAKSLGIDLSVYPSAGPNPNITGIKKLYWGKDAFCVKQGEYVYKVPAEIYSKI